MDNTPQENARSNPDAGVESRGSGNARRKGGLLLEFAMIILGALLALALDDWRDKQERDERDQVVMELVAAELNSNRAELERVRPYHDSMIDPITEARNRMVQEGVFGFPEDWEGTQPSLLTRSAFDLAVMTGVIARLPADTALSLAHAYEVLEHAERRRQNVALTTLQTNFGDGARYLRLQEQSVREELLMAEQLTPLLQSAETDVRVWLD